MRALMIFDGDCGFCTASVNVIRRWIHPDCDIEPWQFTAIEEFDLTPEECTTAVQFVTGDRNVYSGSRAVMQMLRTAPLPWPVLGAIGDAPGVAFIADRVYRWIATNREKLPGSTPACAVNAAA
jgi:predicted DCC family thiol-disulfide oxidoreductase YuxK